MKSQSRTYYIGTELAEEDLKRLNTLCERLDYPITDLIRDVVKDYVDENYEFFTDNKRFKVVA